MELFFAPLACSMATRMAIYEAGAAATFTSVDTKAKKLDDGGDLLAINPMGQVPVLRTPEGELLSENPVVLQYVADRYPASGLAPAAGIGRYRLQQWLNFITSELHKAVFIPLLSPSSNDGARSFARGLADPRLGYLNTHLDGREFLLDRFTVADAYLATVLNWARFCGLDLAPWPNVAAYLARIQQRPSVAKAMAEEMALYVAEKAKRT